MKKKWWIPLLIFVIIPAGLFSLRWLPDPPIVVSQETTFITEPLTDEGLPDYFEYVRSRMREGVTPENNAVIPLVQALGPNVVSPDIRAAWFAELGIEPLPEDGSYFVPLYDERVREKGAAWVLDPDTEKALLGSSGDPEVDLELELWSHDSPLVQKALGNTTFESVDYEDYVSEVYLEAVTNLLSSAWTSETCPPLADWIQENAGPLDLVKQAANRSHYYSPMTSNEVPRLLGTDYPLASKILKVARSLTLRANWHVGEGRFQEAREDIRALHRLARLIADSSKSLVPTFIGLVLDDLACNAHVVLSAEPNVPPELLRQLLEDLSGLPHWQHVSRSIDQFERLIGLETILIAADHPESLARLGGPGDEIVRSFWGGSINWNQVLHEVNEAYDVQVQSTQAVDGLVAQGPSDTELREVETFNKGDWWRIGIFTSRTVRSHLLAEIYETMLMPSGVNVALAQKESNARIDLTQVALALALYRAEHGSYPESLEDLIPGQLDTIPKDTFGGGPLKYERRGEGYLLYAVGKYGIDNGGSNEDGTIVDGEWVDDINDDETGQVDQQGGDLVIRIPIPSWDPTPQPPSPEEPADTTP